MSKRPVRAEVVPRRNESFERLLKRFLKKVKKERIIEQFRENQRYMPPSMAKREKRKRAQRQRERTERKEMRKLKDY